MKAANHDVEQFHHMDQHSKSMEFCRRRRRQAQSLRLTVGESSDQKNKYCELKDAAETNQSFYVNKEETNNSIVNFVERNVSIFHVKSLKTTQ